MSSSPRSLNIFGVTGSVGQSVCDVVLANPGRFTVKAVTANTKVSALAEAAVALRAEIAVIADEALLPALQQALAGTKIEALAGTQSLLNAAAIKVDITIAAMMGFAGLAPLLKALENSAFVGIANKEPLVAAGPLVMRTARAHGTKILPIDSEHNAIFQVFDHAHPEGVEKLILTASGGPFRTWTAEQIERAGVADALKHPNWQMGQKITIDSATMMNKALEVIEAHYLFDIPPERIEVLVHPQSIIHSMVEYSDGSVLAQLGGPDMRTPIAHVLGWPERLHAPVQRLDFKQLAALTFEAPDTQRFPGLGMAYRALSLGSRACLALNAANEVAVEAFLNREIAFTQIVMIVDRALEDIQDGPLAQKFATIKDDNLEGILALDQLVRTQAKTYITEAMSRKAYGSP